MSLMILCFQQQPDGQCMKFSKYFIFFWLIISFGNAKGGLTENVKNFMNESNLSNFNFTNFQLQDTNQLQALAKIGQALTEGSFFWLKTKIAFATGGILFLYAFLCSDGTDNKTKTYKALPYFAIPVGVTFLSDLVNHLLLNEMTDKTKI